LQFPFFWFEEYSTLEAREFRYNLINMRGKICRHGSRLTSATCKNAFGIHFPLSLDEYCTPALDRSLLDLKNKDQVLERYQLKRSGELADVKKRIVPPETKVIAVHQAWLWRVLDRTIVCLSAYVADELSAFMGHGAAFDTTEAATEFSIALWMAMLVNTWERPVQLHGSSEYIFDIFQKSITSLLEEVKSYLANDSVESLDMDEEKRFYDEIVDTREELSMIKSVLFEQERVWRQYLRTVWPADYKDVQSLEERLNQGRTHPARTLDFGLSMTRPEEQFERWKTEISRLEENADRVEKLISNNLDLKQKHASLKEAHSTAIMSSAIFGFTIITIIFTPLSFIIALFALPVDRFQHQQVPSVFTSDAGMYRSRYIGEWLGKSAYIRQ
jgi:hypothetical protein